MAFPEQSPNRTAKVRETIDLFQAKRYRCGAKWGGVGNRGSWHHPRPIGWLKAAT